MKQREDLQPAYYLMFLTRHRDGMQVFGEALSLAQEKWRRAVHDAAVADQLEQLTLLDPEEMFKSDEKHLAEQWQQRIEANLRLLIAEHSTFRIGSHLEAVLTGVAGKACQEHLRVALKRLQAAGVTSSDGKGNDLWRKVVMRTPDTSQP